nr:argininosuccinate synthase [Candidatus Sigynarchaeota archaeon]
MKKIVLMYSGGLDTSCMLKWLQDNYKAKVISFTANIGQELGEKGSFKAIEDKAYKLGVEKHYTVDLQEEFAKGYVIPTIKANGLYQGVYPLSTAIGRPLLTIHAIKIAEKEGADAIAHGCTGKGNDQVRITVTAKALRPDIKVLQPLVSWEMKSRAEEVEYAKKNGIPVANANKKYSTDENLFGRSCECDVLEHPEEIPPEDACAWTVNPAKAPEAGEIIKIGFEKGVPVSVNDKAMEIVSLIGEVHKIAARNGVGRLEHMEDRTVGLKSRETYECPAAVTLIAAHKELEKYVCTKHENSFKTSIDQRWGELVYEGLWVDPLREDLEAFINEVNSRVTGWVKVSLIKGNARVVARDSPFALYSYKLATYELGSTFDQKASEGFMELHGLQSRMAYQLKKNLKK